MQEGVGTGLIFNQAPDHLLVLWRNRTGSISGLVASKPAFFDKLSTVAHWQDLLQQYHSNLPLSWLPNMAAQLQVMAFSLLTMLSASSAHTRCNI